MPKKRDHASKLTPLLSKIYEELDLEYDNIEAIIRYLVVNKLNPSPLIVTRLLLAKDAAARHGSNEILYNKLNGKISLNDVDRLCNCKSVFEKDSFICNYIKYEGNLPKGLVHDYVVRIKKINFYRIDKSLGYLDIKLKGRHAIVESKKKFPLNERSRILRVQVFDKEFYDIAVSRFVRLERFIKERLRNVPDDRLKVLLQINTALEEELDLNDSSGAIDTGSVLKKHIATLGLSEYYLIMFEREIDSLNLSSKAQLHLKMDIDFGSANINMNACDMPFESLLCQPPVFPFSHLNYYYPENCWDLDRSLLGRRFHVINREILNNISSTEHLAKSLKKFQLPKDGLSLINLFEMSRSYPRMKCPLEAIRSASLCGCDSKVEDTCHINHFSFAPVNGRELLGDLILLDSEFVFSRFDYRYHSHVLSYYRYCFKDIYDYLLEQERSGVATVDHFYPHL